jgi:hypothetical protein
MSVMTACREPRPQQQQQQQVLKETYGADAVRSAALAVLEQQFPAYSTASLREMLGAADDNLGCALDLLASLEAEHANQQRPPKAEKVPVSGTAFAAALYVFYAQCSLAHLLRPSM